MMKLQAFRCPECNASLKLEDTRKFCFCEYCGCKILIDDEKSENTTTTNINISKSITNTTHIIDEAKITKEILADKRDKRKTLSDYFGLIIYFALMLSILLGLALYSGITKSIAKSDGKIQAGSYSDLIGEDYRTVEAHFESAGFTNIELIELKDSGIAVWKKGQVSKISIGGVTDFDSTDWFDPDTKVVISYH